MRSLHFSDVAQRISAFTDVSGQPVVGPKCSEIVANYKSGLRDIPEERRSEIYLSGSYHPIRCQSQFRQLSRIIL